MAAVAVLRPGLGAAQGVFTPGREIVAFTFAGTPLGDFPAAFKLLTGNLEAVDKDGVRMLKASAVTEFVIALPEVLPAAFTLEFDLIPKSCCNPEDLAFEGTPTINQGSASARVAWHHERVIVVGGGDMYESNLAAELQAGVIGTLTHIVVTADGETLKLYTNGQRVFTLSDRKFVRSRVLRVFLGGQDERANAVYLARLRISEGGAPVTAVAQQSSALQQTAGGPATGAGSGTIKAAGTGTPATVAPTTGPTIAPRTSPAAMGTVPVSSANPNRTPPGTLPSRTVAMSGFASAGLFTTLAPRTVAMAGFTSIGSFANLASRTVSMPGFTSVGLFGGLAPRIVSMPPFTSVGLFGSLAPRIVSMPAFTSVGLFGSLAPRTVSMSGFTSSGLFSALAPRTVTMAGFTSAGLFPTLDPRTVELAGFTSSGNFITLPPRTITMSGFSAVGITP